ncbi:hypothetical protein MHBO_003217, partial [Bonamia ostreae]
IIEKAINEGFVDKVIDDETIVKINHEKFEKELKKDYLTNFVAKETDIYSTCVVKAILELTAFPSLDDVEETPNFLPEKRKKSEKLEAANQRFPKFIKRKNRRGTHYENNNRRSKT